MFGLKSTGATQMVAALELHARHIEQIDVRLEQASDYIYMQTAHRFDTEGDGSWPALSESTVAKKESQGYPEAARVLYAEGNLYESATSPNGPYSERLFVHAATHPMIGNPTIGTAGVSGPIPPMKSTAIAVGGSGNYHQVVMLVDWENDGWQIPVVLSEGSEHLPGRPIWPPAEEMVHAVGQILMKGL